MTAAPTPVTTAPTAVTAATPAHLFGRKAVHVVPGGNGGTGILVRGRQGSALGERLRQKRRSLRARGHRGRARGKSKSEFQKVAAFHDISLSLRDGE